MKQLDSLMVELLALSKPSPRVGHGVKKCGVINCRGKKCFEIKYSETLARMSQITKEIAEEKKRASDKAEVLSKQEEKEHNRMFLSCRIQGMESLKDKMDFLKRNIQMSYPPNLRSETNDVVKFGPNPPKIKVDDHDYKYIKLMNPGLSENEIRQLVFNQRKLLDYETEHEQYVCEAQGLIISISNRYKKVALALNIIIDKVMFVDKERGKVFKSVVKLIGGFPFDVFYLANAVRHAQEWYDALSEYQIENPAIEIKLDDHAQLKAIFKEKKQDTRGAESIVHLCKIWRSERKGRKMEVEDLSEEKICAVFPSLLKMDNFVIMDYTFKNYKKRILAMIKD